MADATSVEDEVIDSIMSDIQDASDRIERELGNSVFYTAARRFLISASEALKCERDTHT